MMKGFSMNKVLGTIKKRNTDGDLPFFVAASSSDNPTLSADPENDTPEGIANRCVKSFCESRGSASGDDVVFLPAIVEAAVASPAAATECARLIRKFLGRDYWTKPSYQYNAIMLIRILCDNPGQSFTRNLDKKFVDTTKELLKSGRDVSVRQMLMETLDSFENTKGYDEGLALIIEMWRKEKEKAYRAYGVSSKSRTVYVPPFQGQYQHSGYQQGAGGPYQQGPYQQPHRSRSSGKSLPDPVELANRLEEARTSAKLLEQVVANTPPTEVLDNELIREFSDRCSGAAKSIQGYLSATNPAPDNDTMENLIDTNEQLQQALNHHRRAVLQARKHLGLGQGDNDRSSTSLPSASPISSLEYRPDVPPKAIGSGQGGSGFGVGGAGGMGARGGSGGGSGSGSSSEGKGKKAAKSLDPYHAAAVAGPSGSRRHSDASSSNLDPFRDPAPEQSSSSARVAGDDAPRLSYEPFHPGFGGSSGGGAAAAADSSSRPPRRTDALAEPVTPVSDDGYDDERRRAPSGGGGGQPAYGGASHLQPAKDPGSVYRY
ncbi:hypothetical protein QBC38DRAFT_375314 [Podospora fimiseda]|uniref:GAT domain-containing protein n=1 Tax=Podospora fimiseda TaxID=252190 RepID=A0AAN6YNG0_9PEZI|nr:hypothetical protein QBC38DRAFT_375314 [Podospora fimiseda]